MKQLFELLNNAIALKEQRQSIVNLLNEVDEQIKETNDQIVTLKDAESFNQDLHIESRFYYRGYVVSIDAGDYEGTPFNWVRIERVLNVEELARVKKEILI